MSDKNEPHRFLMRYRHCGQSWESTWSCACNDECPVCRREIEPYEVEDFEPEESLDKSAAPETHSLLVVSTAHATLEEAQTLDASGYARGEYGWFFYVGDAESDVLPELTPHSEGLKGVIEKAQLLGCAYVLLDRDASELEGVPAYEWPVAR